MASREALLVLVVGAVLAADVAGAVNYRPIIGVLTEPIVNTSWVRGLGFRDEPKAYFDAAYVKWVESGGARVAVVPFDAGEAELTRIFNGINGVLFTGGSQSLYDNTTYFQAAKFLFGLALDAFDKRGDAFPIWGTCQGFQLLAILGAQDQSVLAHYAFDSENLPLPLELTPAAAQSRLLGSSAPPDVIHIFATENVTLNLHHDGILPETFAKHPRLSKMYDLLSINHDRKGRPFGSTLEGQKYPIFATQWHPERNQFDWDTVERTPHTFDAVRAMQYVSNFFVSQARQNNHAFPTPEVELKALIYNYNATYTGNDGSISDTQTYFFPAFHRQ